MAGVVHVPGSRGESRFASLPPYVRATSGCTAIPLGRTGRDSPTPTAGGPFSFRRAVPIFAACAIPWGVIRQSCVRSAAGRRSSDIGRFVRAGAPISTSAVGSLAATRLRPTRGTSLTSPRTTDHSIVVDSLVKRSASLKEHRMRFSRASPADRTHPSRPGRRGAGGLSLAHGAHLGTSPKRPVVGFGVASGWLVCPSQRHFRGSPFLGRTPGALTGQSLFLLL
jgi:hypothetical protein